MPEPTVAWSEAKPYETIYFGLFNDQHTTRSYPTADKKGTADVTYSLYIPRAHGNEGSPHDSTRTGKHRGFRIRRERRWKGLEEGGR